MIRIVQSNTPWLAALWLCCGTAAVVAQDEVQQEEKNSGDLQEIIREVINDAKKNGDAEVSVNVESIMVQEDGDKGGKKKVTGQVVIKGPDGESRIIDLKDAMENGDHSVITFDGGELKVLEDSELDLNFDILKNNSAFRLRSVTRGASVPKYRVGVQCEAVDAAVRAHVDVPDEALMVRDVIEDGAAAKAGVQQYDIIVRVGETSVGSLDALVEQIQASEGKELSFIVLRKGVEKTLTVTPEKRKASDVRQMILRSLSDGMGNDGDQNFKLILNGEDMDDVFQFEALRPGVLLNKSANMEKLMKRLPMIVRDIEQVVEDRGGIRSVRIRRNRRSAETKDAEEPEPREGDHDDAGESQEEDEDDDESDQLQSRVRKLTKEIERLESALQKLQRKRR